MFVVYTYKGLIDEEVPKNIEEVKFADDVTVIRRYACARCNNLKKIVIPNQITEIEDYAFIGCLNLRSVFIGECVKVIGIRTFFGCFKLEQLILLNRVEEIHMSAFCCCYILRSIFIPESVTMISKRAFASCRNLDYVVLMTSEKQNIHELAFEGWDLFEGYRSLKRVFKISKELLQQKLPVIAKYPVGFETLKRLSDIDCKGVQCTNAERLYPFMAQSCISNIDQKYDADHLSSIYCLLRSDPSFCYHF